MLGERRELLERFEIYDKAVDVVSCWDAYLNFIYEDEFSEFYFDRFPELEAKDGYVTPDFTAFFNQSYGLIGEIKRTFPQDKRALESELNQLKRYDEDLGLQTAKGKEVVPEVCDIVVIIEGSSAPQIGTRLQRIIAEEEEFKFNSQPILLRYQYNQDALQSRYEFQRVTQLEFEFQDNHLDLEDTLSNTIGEQGEYGTLSCYPRHFNANKVQKPLCNDAPPGPYLATHLWHKIFPEYLSDDQYEKWQATDGAKELPISITAGEVTESLNDYMVYGTAREIWVQRALDFLCGADLAEEGDSSKEYTIRFMGLVKDVNSSSVQEGTEERLEVKELAQTFIQRYCEKSEEKEEPKIEEYEEDENDDSSKQSGLGDFT